MTEQTQRSDRSPGGQGEIEKSYVDTVRISAPLPPEYEKGHDVRLAVLENGIRKVRKMEIVEAKLWAGKWKYQIKPSGGSELHKDKNGNDWFKEDELDWWS